MSRDVNTCYGRGGEGVTFKKVEGLMSRHKDLWTIQLKLFVYFILLLKKNFINIDY